MTRQQAADLLLAAKIKKYGIEESLREIPGQVHPHYLKHEIEILDAVIERLKKRL